MWVLGGWKRQKWLLGQKFDFFKVQDIDTPIQPRKKKHQNNVSSDLKSFRTTSGVSEIIAKFWIFPSQITFLWDFPREVFFGSAKTKSLELSQRQRNWFWNVFRAKITCVWCFFLRGWIGVSISWTLKKINILSHEQFLALSAQQFGV